jgi:hypothetical protein
VLRDGIDWAEVGAGGRFERIVSTLLSTLHPDSERIDGAGGDDGRDHQLRTGDRLDLWQSKYFLRRLSESRSRTRQITQSLEVAAALEPASWTLVTPMVPSPEERAWFEQLGRGYRFPVSWKGGDWLDARLAEHPAIVRYFHGPHDSYVALLRELADERDALVDGLAAALPRIETLAAKINDSNPFYRVDFTVRDGRIVGVELCPQYRGAEQDSPVTLGFTVITGPADAELAERFRAAMEWGEQVVLPASHVRNVAVDGPPGFGGTHDRAEVVIGPAPAEPVDLPMRLALRAPDGRQLCTLPIRCVTRFAGLRGVTLCGQDLTGVVDIRLRLDPQEHQFTLTLSSDWSRPLLPGAALPVLRFLRHAVPPSTLELTVLTVTTRPVSVPPGLGVSEEHLRLVEDLDRLQAATGEQFPVPRDLTLEDFAQLRRAIRLLDGDQVPIGTGPITVHVTDPRPYLEVFDRTPLAPMTIDSDDPYIAQVAGHDIPLGRYTVRLAQAQLDRSSITPTADGGHRLQVHPGPDTAIEIALTPAPATDERHTVAPCPTAPTGGGRGVGDHDGGEDETRR